MAPSKDRQRALARAKLERQMARRAAAARRRRQIQAGIAGAVALVLVVLGAFWLVSELGADEGKKSRKAEPGATPTPGPCKYKDQPKDAKAKERKDVGTPKAGEEAREGIRVMALKTNLGEITIHLDAEKAPCNTESIAYLASKKFYRDSPCHRLTDQGLFVLQCGDPSGTGRGGPTYQVNNENLPIEQRPPYPEGVVAMANSGPDTNGSQFFIVYKDTQLNPDYTIVGEVVEGLEIVKKVAKAGVKPSKKGNPGDGKPKKEIILETVTVSEPQPRPKAATAPAEPTPSTEPSKS